MGVPFLDYWTEFPPLFPFLAYLVNFLTGGQQHSFDYLLTGMFTAAQAGSLYIFVKINQWIHGEIEQKGRNLLYFSLLLPLFYGWGYFDPVAVFFMMAAIYALTKGKDLSAGFMITLGALTKWFPIMVVPVIWKKKPGKRALVITIFIVGIMAVVWGSLFVLNPVMTQASFTAQIKKGSWETLWALIDGNLGTGNFVPEIDRQRPQTALLSSGNAPKVSPWITLLVFAGFGIWLFLKTKLQDLRQLTSFVGLTFIIFFIWSPGYSPQWLLYLLPLIFLSLPISEAGLFGLVLVLINLLEWPVLLSRGFFWSLYLIVPLRSLVMALLGFSFYQSAHD
ncbi:MAG: hypothetical protein KGY46_00580 [Anaerolineales bacterium]|nr:hypothetical protein [Anaerolineales bacterium]